MKDLWKNVVIEAARVGLTQAHAQFIMIAVLILLLVLGGGAPSGGSGWAGG